MVLPEGPGKAGRSPDGFAMRIYHEEGPNEVGKSPDGLPEGPGKPEIAPENF